MTRRKGAVATRRERFERVSGLRAQGLKLREIADETGFSISYVSDLLRDPTGERNRQRKRRYEHPCSSCGRPVNPNGLAKGHSGMCARCFRESETKRSREWLLSEVQRFVGMYGRPPRSWEWSVTQAANLGKPAPPGGWPAAPNAIRQFGSWRKFLRAAGYDTPAQGGNNGGPGSLSDEELTRTVDLCKRFSQQAAAEILGVSQHAVSLRLRKARSGTMAATLKPQAVLEREMEKTRARIETLKTQLAETEADLRALEAAKAALNSKGLKAA